MVIGVGSPVIGPVANIARLQLLVDNPTGQALLAEESHLIAGPIIAIEVGYAQFLQSLYESHILLIVHLSCGSFAKSLSRTNSIEEQQQQQQSEAERATRLT